MISKLLRWLAACFDGKLWTQRQAVELATMLYEMNLVTYNAYPALTGGCLYKKGKRKDLDILFYPANNRGKKTSVIEKDMLLKKLATVDFTIGQDYGWCVKATWQGKDVDLFFSGYGFTKGHAEQLAHPLLVVSCTGGGHYR